MEENIEKPRTVSKGIIVVVLVVVIVLAAGVYEFSKPKAENAMTPAPTAAESMTGPTAMEQAGAYKDGTYDVEGDYLSPGGEEHIGVSLTLKGDLVEDVTFTSKATRPNSVKFQGQFATGYKELVVGKNIDEVTLDVVSGSSLTPKGFNDALAKIKELAKS